MNPSFVPKLLVFGWLAVAALGLLLWVAPRVPGLDRLGSLPGDIHYRGPRVSFYFPWVSCLVLSLLLTLLLKVVGCTKQENRDPEAVRLETQISSMEKELKEFEGQIRRANNDPGLKNKLSEDRELLKSRLERLKEILKQKH